MLIYNYDTELTTWNMQVIPGVLSNCALLAKFKRPVDVGTVLEKILMCMCVSKKE